MVKPITNTGICLWQWARYASATLGDRAALNRNQAVPTMKGEN
jgi:hypothetical protein